MKVLYMTNYPAPYRVDFFNELGKYCDLTVTFEETPEAQTHRNTAWFHTNYDNFKPLFLKSTFKHKGRTLLSMEIIKEIKKDYDHIIVGVYSTNTAMLAIIYMLIHRIHYLIETDGGVAKTGENIIERLKQLLLSHAKGYFSPSKLSDKYLMHYGADENQIFRYPFTSLCRDQILDKSILKEEREMLRQELEMHENHIVLGVGQFIPRKGWESLIQISPELKHIGFYIVGGVPTDYYIRIKETTGANNVHFIDFKKQEVLKKYYYAADLFVLPTHEDIWGLVVNEAISCGLPVITTNKCVAGIEMIENGVNGYIVDDSNLLQLKSSIEKYFAIETNRFAMQENARKKAAEYTIEKMVDAHINALKSISHKIQDGK